MEDIDLENSRQIYVLDTWYFGQGRELIKLPIRCFLHREDAEKELQIHKKKREHWNDGGVFPTLLIEGKNPKGNHNEKETVSDRRPRSFRVHQKESEKKADAHLPVL